MASVNVRVMQQVMVAIAIHRHQSSLIHILLTAFALVNVRIRYWISDCQGKLDQLRLGAGRHFRSLPLRTTVPEIKAAASSLSAYYVTRPGPERPVATDRHA